MQETSSENKLGSASLKHAIDASEKVSPDKMLSVSGNKQQLINENGIIGLDGGDDDYDDKNDQSPEQDMFDDDSGLPNQQQQFMDVLNDVEDQDDNHGYQDDN